MLYATPVDDSMQTLPSPEVLKNKIIIKAKKISEITDGESEANESSEDEEEKNESDCDDSDDPPDQMKSTDDTISAASKSVKDLDLKASAYKTADELSSAEKSDSLTNKVTPEEFSIDSATKDNQMQEMKYQGSDRLDTANPSDENSTEVLDNVSCYLLLYVLITLYIHIRIIKCSIGR